MSNCIWYVNYYYHRAWQRKLYSLVQDSDNGHSPEPATFRENLQDIISVWREREPKFIDYFEAGYANRAGIKQPCIYTAIVVMHKYYEHCVEKWALCYIPSL